LITRAVRRKIAQARVARLATIDAKGGPHLVPLCFIYDGKAFYTAIDHKPKSVSPERLARVQNIRARPHVALLIDHYEEDWAQLWFILIRGKARLLPKSASRERASAIRKLRSKYSQYSKELLADDALIIRIIPERVTIWPERVTIWPERVTTWGKT
jgi:PPOX class probable F420-dependent enzyme